MDSILGARLRARYAQLWCSTELTVSSQQLARVRGMAAITATSTSNTDSSVSLDVRPFPANPDPGRYYDLC